MNARKNFWRSFRWIALSLVAAGALMLLDGGVWPKPARLWLDAQNRTPQEIIRYLAKRLEGHNRLEGFLLPPLQKLQRMVEREPLPGTLPTHGKGQQTTSIETPVSGITVELPVSSPQEIRQALLEAKPGTRIVISPGIYPISEKLRIGTGGTSEAPIVLSAKEPGTVWLEFAQVEGILVDRPYWVLENLNMRGICPHHDDCEHAIHVVGNAAHTTIRNNHLSDFDAHIKVNGSNGQWPDHGLIAHNTLTNSAPRVTLKPVAMLDLVGARHWQVEDNLVTNFANRDGNRVAYGMYMKGASEGGRFERNLIICSPNNISATGIRVGISFGGGNTGSRFCREGSCVKFEHNNGAAINNIVAHCNDTGIDVNHSSQILLAHNTLINTSGIATRGAPADAQMYGNLYEGRAVARDGTVLTSSHDRELPLLHPADRWDRLAFESLPENSIPMVTLVTNDFFKRPRFAATQPGAVAKRSP